VGRLSEQDVTLLRRAIRLAMSGRGHVEPNPMVACVIARDGRVIGEGYHAQFGGPHAEPTALARCEEDPRGATAYVTLEPCCHTNKKTPPCAPRLIEAGIARVVIGCLDSNPAVNGNGVAMLRAAGIVVDPAAPERADVQAEAKQLIAPFLLRHSHHQPYVTMKWTQTSDGCVSLYHSPLRISSPAGRKLVHELRARCDAILVGVHTAWIDNPMLTVRHVPQVRTPRRLVVDTELRLPHESRLIASAGEVPTTFFCATATASTPRAEALRRAGVQVIGVPELFSQEGISLLHVLRELPDVTHLLVEPGPTLAESFFNTGLVDRLWVFRSRTVLAGPHGLAAADIPPDFVETGTLAAGDDELTEYLNPKSPAFFAATPSADFVLARSPVV
jgi:diaminohydroxyphosphoribosylaminopyrimidine deaminase/5-amino-6-(5-phosphoribosylamino)uracil reductase